jgi:3-deoxy-D-manno-octulosonic-acid transferase
MIFFYDLILSLYAFFIQIAAFFGNEKARLWSAGRKDIFEKIETQLNKNQDNTRKIIWIHVSSLGEFEQGRPIIEALKNNHAITQSPNIILTFFSPSGYEMRKNYPLADHVFYLPIDNARNARRFLDLVKPDLAIFVKYEFWFHYLTQLQKKYVPILLVSATFREKQFSSWNPYSRILRRILQNFTQIFLQDTPSFSLLKKHNFTNIVLSGDTRVDRVAAIAAEGKRLDIVADFVGNFVENLPVFVGGSTWEADEKRILPLFKNPKFANWRFVFAPHDVNLKNIERLKQLLPEKSVRYSEILKNNAQKPIYTEGSFFLENLDCRILIIDNIGLLSALYRYGKIAYIGGGFGSGIHNTLEPIAHGLPVLFGEKYEKFTEAVKLAETGGGFVVNAENGSVETIMERLLIPENYDKASAAARQYIAENRGATAQVVDAIQKILFVLQFYPIFSYPR